MSKFREEKGELLQMVESRRKRTISNLTILPESNPDERGFWDGLNQRISQGKVIPIISNSVRNDRIFDIDADYELGLAQDEAKDPSVADLTVDEELAVQWATYLNYPFPDKNRLARVAVYNQVKSPSPGEAKANYLVFLKKLLLKLAEADENVPVDLIEELRRQSNTLNFSHIATELDYPQFKADQTDPLRLLARLPLPIYVTTSYYDFMERALRAEGRSPHIQICPWSDVPDMYANPNFIPTVEQPLVYHLHGFEQYPATLVLSEDDYMQFLVRVAKDTTDSKEPVIPLYLRGALANSSLILLGYRLQDWDFRVLFRGVIKSNPLQWRSVALQLNPTEQGGIINPKEAQEYLRQYFQYFREARFEVEWGNTDNFVSKLWREWDKWRQTRA